MTSTTDMAGHPDVTEISDLTEGLLPPSRTADVRRHLDECELCADVYTSLEEIRGLLGSVPGPTRMPADVAGRIDAALAAEALLDATAPDVTDAPALIGDNFSQRWKGGNVGDLFKIVKGTMPADRPNTLEAPQYADIIAFVLKTNGYPAGSQPLSDDPAALTPITFKK